MRRLTIILLTVMLIVLCSCELAVKAPGPGRMHILVYGNDYAGTPNVLYKTIPDAVQVGNALLMLSEKAGYEYDITYLMGPSKSYNSQAIRSEDVINDVSRATLINKLSSMSQSGSINSSDITVIYFSCHGFSEYKQGQTVPYSTDTSVHSYLAANDTSAYGSQYVLIPLSTIRSLIEAIPGTKVVISDFCFSGGFVQSDYVSVTSGEYSGMTSTELLECKDWINESSSLFFLSAARYNEKSYENLPYHGNFTTALLEALGWDDKSYKLVHPAAETNGYISLFNLANYTANHDLEAKQTPMTSGGSNDIILFSF